MQLHSILPTSFSEKLALTTEVLSSEKLCELTQCFSTWLKDQFSSEETGRLIATRADFVDHLLTKLWCQHQLDEYQISLIAVGGYGRGELHPHSDVDLLLLTQEKIDKPLEEKISAFITQLWDVKLDVGHSVRSVKECLRQETSDVTVATNLMEMRLICGNEPLSQQLQPLLNQDVFWTSKKFFIAKRNEQEKRHQQYHGAAYTLEPNLKANPGGLRDIQTIAWVAKRHFVADSLEELVEHNYLTLNEFYELLECQDYLWRMRFALHFVAGRSENRLLFDYQADVATLMGFGGQGKASVERMMKRFFRVIGRVAELNSILLQHFEQAILMQDDQAETTTIDRDFSYSNGLIKTSNARVFMTPAKIIKMFLLIAQHDQIKGIHSQTLRVMRNARRRLISGLNDYAESRRLFIEIIRHPRGLGLAFTLMHRHSIIGAYLPEWRSIVGQMQFDLFHAYSVDEHSYRLIKNLYRFSQKEHNHQFPLCSKIVQRNRKPEVLFLAGIFHDIAKGRGGNHAELGAIDALEFSKTHQLNDHDGRMISWLVKHHLLMSVTAQRRDISDESVIQKFGEIVRDEAHLDFLYCLTVADMRATNESLWNGWKASLLEELYYNTKRAFRRGLEKPVDLRSKIRENQRQAVELLQANNIDKSAFEPLWHDFKADYFLRYTPEQISWHSQNILTHDNTTPLVLISSVPYRGGTQVFIYTKVHESIFSATVSLLATRKLSIHDAKIITSKSGFTLNTFVVLDQRGKAIDDQSRTKDIAQAITTTLTNQTFSDTKIQPISQRLKNFTTPTSVSFIKTNNKRGSLLEITTRDRPALLALISRIFRDNQIQIHSAKITTFGEKAEDVFTISNKQNQTLTAQEQVDLTTILCEELS
ncbi:MAG: [protein-PII] uridylyltransferase [Colwellia sp.]|nr:[protein-PII] uridylyltransferase [Colwellia sp.]